MAKAKRIRKPKKVQTTMHVAFGSIEVNGQKVSGLDYRRTEYEDGSVEESGLPDGLESKPTLSDLLGFAAGQALSKAKAK